MDKSNTKLVLEILVAIIIHPLAVILVWLNLASRKDLTSLQKLLWVLVALIWSIGPILYLFLAEGSLW